MEENKAPSDPRHPLTSRYAPYVIDTDTSLSHMRRRLRTALQQTRQLQLAFTHRVYEKYRVVLQPPAEMDPLLLAQQPKLALAQRQQEIARIRTDKETEKKNAIEFKIAGLHLVVLPEENTTQLPPNERGPTHQGQRHKTLSQAAAAAGEMVLERVRKLKSEKVEQTRQEQLALMGNTEAVNNHVAATSAATAAIPTNVTKKKTPLTLTPATLLSLDPHTDQVGGTRLLASTMALLHKNYKTSSTTQQRLRHPHPESLGGRRRAGETDEDAQLQWTLPPLPEHKRQALPVQTDTPIHPAVAKVLETFREKAPVTKIGLLHRLKDAEPNTILAFSVLHAIGLIGRATTNNTRIFREQDTQFCGSLTEKYWPRQGAESLRGGGDSKDARESDKEKSKDAAPLGRVRLPTGDLNSANNNNNFFIGVNPQGLHYSSLLGLGSGYDRAALYAREQAVLASSQYRIAAAFATQSMLGHGQFANQLSSSMATYGSAQAKKDEASDTTTKRPRANSSSVGSSQSTRTDAKMPAMKKRALSDPLTKQPVAESAASENDTEVLPTFETSISDDKAMKLYPPKRPQGLSVDDARLIRKGKLHEAVNGASGLEGQLAVLEYLNSIATAVPIPKALVFGPLKERLKNVGNSGAPPIARDVVVSCILVWLWANHEDHFQGAFLKNGRLDVDPDCKWLIQAAVDTAIRELTIEIADSIARGQGVFAEAAAARKAAAAGKTAAPGTDTETPAPSKNVEITTAAIVSKSLMIELSIDQNLNTILPHFQAAIEYLDEARMQALTAKCQERALLATFIARKATMSESFSHAYTSAMVRAGEAIGHDKLFELVQNEEVRASTMIPFDIFTDETDEWEDPCKPEEGFSPELSADDLVRRAHARAMIQKSLRKLQDRHNIRGGVSVYGPYTDPPADTAAASEASSVQSGQSSTTLSMPVSLTQKLSGLKRKIAAISEPTPPPGTGSAAATSWSLYDPKHTSTPLVWDPSIKESQPYGRFSIGERARSVSLALASRGNEKSEGGKKQRRSLSFNTPPPPLYGSSKDDEEGESPRSTYPIDWVDVAGIFQNVELPRKSPPSRSISAHHEAIVPLSGDIIAPFCRKFVGVSNIEQSGESDSEEDLRDEIVLQRHQEVLDVMKARLTDFLEARKKQQERRKIRKGKATNG